LVGSHEETNTYSYSNTHAKANSNPDSYTGIEPRELAIIVLVPSFRVVSEPSMVVRIKLITFFCWHLFIYSKKKKRNVL
jgi:hypothetical protein